MSREDIITTGICRKCGCGWNTPCIDEKYGACWWIVRKKRFAVIVFMD